MLDFPFDVFPDRHELLAVDELADKSEFLMITPSNTIYTLTLNLHKSALSSFKTFGCEYLYTNFYLNIWLSHNNVVKIYSELTEKIFD